jgi:hypothetical protein
MRRESKLRVMMAASMAWCSVALLVERLGEGVVPATFQTQMDAEKLQGSPEQGQCAGSTNKKHFSRLYKSPLDGSTSSNPACMPD